MDHGDHRAGLVGEVGHAAMPEAHVADQHAAGGHVRLQGFALVAEAFFDSGWQLDVAVVEGAGGV